MPENSQPVFQPFQAPFRYNRSGQWIEDAKGERLLDVRGWGFLTGQGSRALGLPEQVAAKLQDGLGEKVAALMNREAGKASA